MIRIHRNKGCLQLTVNWSEARPNANIVNDDKPAWAFSHDLGDNNAAAAAVMIEALRDAFSRRLQNIRKQAYAQGWKDAKARKAKATTFSGSQTEDQHSGGCYP